MRRSSPLVVLALAVTGCGDDTGPASGASDRTGAVLIDGERTRFTVETCEKDGRMVHLTARGAEGEALEVVAEVNDDALTVKPTERSSIVVRNRDQGDVSAYGAMAWSEQGRTGPPPGQLTASRRIDNLVQLSGRRLAVIDEEGQPTGAEVETLILDLHCPALA